MLPCNSMVFQNVGGEHWGGNPCSWGGNFRVPPQTFFGVSPPTLQGTKFGGETSTFGGKPAISPPNLEGNMKKLGVPLQVWEGTKNGSPPLLRTWGGTSFPPKFGGEQWGGTLFGWGGNFDVGSPPIGGETDNYGLIAVKFLRGQNIINLHP